MKFGINRGGPTRWPRKVTCGERDIHQGGVLEMVRVVEQEVKKGGF